MNTIFSLKRKSSKNDVYTLFFPEACLSLDCQIIFSDRKSISIQIKEDASVQVRAPYLAPKKAVVDFIEEKRDWIYKNHLKIKEHMETSAPSALTPLQEQQIAVLRKRFQNAAKLYFPKRCAELQKLTGGYYTKITVRNQKTRWGSCSQTGTLSFNYRLMMAEPAVIDYVIIHELCHLTHMNHSKEFWNKVAAVMPDYATHKRWLKEHGNELTEEHYLLSLM